MHGARTERVRDHRGNDLAAILDCVVPAGGRIAVPKTEIGNGFGFFAHFLDTEGNKVGLHAMAWSGRMSTLLLSSWQRAWHDLPARGTGSSVRDAVLARYAEAHRQYHTLQHLEECLSLFESVRDAADRPAEVEMALWFHDAVYDLKASDNEALSAHWAEQELHQAGVSSEAASRVRGLILATQHTGLPQSRDEKVLVDIDLAILGAPEARFAEYERQIRAEYAHVPELLFRLKRCEILQSFLNRPEIYGTPVLHRQLEARARANLAAAVAANAA